VLKIVKKKVENQRIDSVALDKHSTTNLFGQRSGSSKVTDRAFVRKIFNPSLVQSIIFHGHCAVHVACVDIAG
jgi:hypothetical protein